ncbi:hypothetical protein KFL_002360110 [Klebsormidium nitens]|uniref:Uncharacterized protein n=1 Tax=Klebsormidium nitens TaxID=105231 RepID=A0A0U9HTB0_KLENI|nr:hypothetical protein KFL_002360110 [Klebsormidium nitens]|eukprot:GAQ85459.1 hypothetical protein KFL_002360110 [Klebsormidium nitens]
MGVQRISSAWKTLIPGMSEVICRVEISGVAAQRAETAPAKVGKAAITWDEKVSLPVYEGAKELRLLLLSPGVSGATPRTVANGGFYVEDIMASPSNCKWFELFAPGGNAGGTIKLSILYTAATTTERQRRQSVNAETQIEAQASHELTSERMQSKSFNDSSSDAAINTDPIAAAPAAAAAPARRSLSVTVGVGPSPVPSQKNSPAAAAALATQRRVSRQSRTPKTPEPQPETAPIAIDARPPPTDREPTGESPPAQAEGSPIEFPQIPDETPIETVAGSAENFRVPVADAPTGIPADVPTDIPADVPADRQTSEALPSKSIAVQPAADLALESLEESTPALTNGHEHELSVIDVETAPEETALLAEMREETIFLAETSDTELVSSCPAKKPRGIPSVVLFGVTAVAAVIGAVVLGSKRGGNDKKSGRPQAPPQSRADIIHYASGPRA